ncbi:MAG: hypothetical protein RIM99_14485 [Cyclobacteriaceae bacterium]
MSFFNESTANSIQLISAPLEVLGLSLAFIELFRKKLAKSIEEKLNLFHGTIESWTTNLVLSSMARFFYSEVRSIKDGRRKVKLASKVFYSLLTTIIVFSIVSYSFDPFWLANKFQLVPSNFDRISIEVMNYFIRIVLIPISIVFWFGLYISKLDKLTGGSALGSIGLLIASIGVLGEAYQVVFILLNK